MKQLLLTTCSLLLLAAASVAYSAPTLTSSYAHSYFTMAETFSPDASAFVKWTSMVVRYEQQHRVPDDQCDRVPFHPCVMVEEWRGVLKSVSGRSLEEQLENVNDYANAFPYIEDYVNWHVEDYWETPYEFLTVSGDCEDYAITKYYSLRALGVPASRMRVMIVQDLNLGGVIHAVLGIYTGRDLFILDNQIKQVVNAQRIYHYLPIYGINEEGWWAYHPL